MAQKQAQGGNIRRIIPRWLSTKRVIMIIIILLLLPGVGWIIDAILLLWWRAKSATQNNPK